MKKSEILRRRDLFKVIALRGRSLKGEFVRCSYLVLKENESPRLQVAFKVHSRLCNAVKRNRLRRLMREAVSRERLLLDENLATRRTNLGLILYYRGNVQHAPERITLRQIRKDVEMFCTVIASSV